MLRLFSQNLLEEATVQAPGNAYRLYDRDASLLYTLTNLAELAPLSLAVGWGDFVIDIDLGEAREVSDWALVNPSITSTVTLLAGATYPPETEIDTVASADATFLRSVAPVSYRYWRLQVAASTTPPTIGQLLLGVPRQIELNPTVESAGRKVVGNVVRDETPTGLFRTTKRGPSRVRLAYAWNWLSSADYDELVAAFEDTDEGAKAFLLQDELEALRWMQITSQSLEPRPVQGPEAAGGLATAIQLELNEAL
jgi:hypothetical protein